MNAVEAARCSGFNRNLHSRISFVHTPVRLTLLHARDSVARLSCVPLLTVSTVNSVQTRKARRHKTATETKAEADKFVSIRQSSAEAESKALQGQGTGVRFQTDFCTRGCHWISRVFASAFLSGAHCSLTGWHRKLCPNTEGIARQRAAIVQGLKDSIGTVRVFRQKFALEDAIGSHACSLEALTCV